MSKSKSVASFFVTFIVISTTWAVELEDPKALIAKVIKTAGGEEKLLKKFQIHERLNISSNPNGKASERTSILEPPQHWWLGKRDRVIQDQEPAIYLVWAWTLRVLIDSKSQVTTLADVTEDNKPAFGLRISGSVNPPMDLYFDKTENRLVRIDWRSDIHRFSHWKEHDGVQYPTKCIGFKKASGKPWYYSEITKLERVGDKKP